MTITIPPSLNRRKKSEPPSPLTLPLPLSPHRPGFQKQTRKNRRCCSMTEPMKTVMMITVHTATANDSYSYPTRVSSSSSYSHSHLYLYFQQPQPTPQKGNKSRDRTCNTTAPHTPYLVNPAFPCPPSPFPCQRAISTCLAACCR